MGCPKALVPGFSFLSSFLRTPLRPGTRAWLRGPSVAGDPAASVIMGFPLSQQGRHFCPRDWATGCFYDVFIFTCVSCHFFKKANRTIVSQYNCLSVFFISLFVK